MVRISIKRDYCAEVVRVGEKKGFHLDFQEPIIKKNIPYKYYQIQITKAFEIRLRKETVSL